MLFELLFASCIAKNCGPVQSLNTSPEQYLHTNRFAYYRDAYEKSLAYKQSFDNSIGLLLTLITVTLGLNIQLIYQFPLDRQGAAYVIFSVFFAISVFVSMAYLATAAIWVLPNCFRDSDYEYVTVDLATSIEAEVYDALTGEGNHGASEPDIGEIDRRVTEIFSEIMIKNYIDAATTNENSNLLRNEAKESLLKSVFSSWKLTLFALISFLFSTYIA